MIRVYARKRADRNAWQLFYDSPTNGKRVTRSIDVSSKSDATKAAGAWESELNKSQYVEPGTWDEFWIRFQDECLPAKSKSTINSYLTAGRQFIQTVGPINRLSEVDSSLISVFQSKLRKKQLSESSIASYLRHLKAAFAWAVRVNLMRQLPAFSMPRIHRSEASHGRPLTDAEFQRMLSACEKEFPNDAGPLRDLINGLWLSGLRISEALRLSWDDGPVRLDFTAKHARIIWQAEGQKARRNEITPITPDFKTFLDGLPVKSGKVFQVTIDGVAVGRDRIGKMVSEVGQAAAVKIGDRFASAHDLRRSFATRWAMLVKPITLRAIMRHADIKTTLQYYVGLDSDSIGDELAAVAKPAKAKGRLRVYRG